MRLWSLLSYIGIHLSVNLSIDNLNCPEIKFNVYMIS